MSSVGKRVIDFLSKSCDQFHAVSCIEQKLLERGFVKLNENSVWSNLCPGGKYFVSRNSSSVCAFTVGKKYSSGNGIKLLSGKLKIFRLTKSDCGYLPFF